MNINVQKIKKEEVLKLGKHMKINKNLSKYQKKAIGELRHGGKVYMYRVVGSGQWTRFDEKYSVSQIEDIGLVQGRHFLVGNDAPRGGKIGDYLKLTKAGLRLKMFKDEKEKIFNEKIKSPAILKAFKFFKKNPKVLLFENPPCPHRDSEIWQAKLRAAVLWEDFIWAFNNFKKYIKTGEKL